MKKNGTPRKPSKNELLKPRFEGTIKRPKAPTTIRLIGQVAPHRPNPKTTPPPKTPDGVAKSIDNEPLRAADVASSEPSSLRTAKLVDVPLNGLQVQGGRRPVDPEKVRILAASIARIGLRTPIAVRLRLIRPAGMELVAGLHRVEAARMLGWTSIPSVLMDEEGVARRWQWEENLCRADLVALDRAEHTAEWARLATAAVPISGQGVQKTAGRPEGGIALAARSLPVAGKTEEARRKTVERSLKIDGIDDEAKHLARSLGLADNQSALVAIAKATTPEAQVAKIRELATRRRNSRLRQTSAGHGASDNPPGASGSAGDLHPSHETAADDDMVARFRAAWEGTAANAIWLSAPLDVRERIITDVFLVERK